MLCMKNTSTHSHYPPDLFPDGSVNENRQQGRARTPSYTLSWFCVRQAERVTLFSSEGKTVEKYDKCYLLLPLPLKQSDLQAGCVHLLG